MNHQPSNQDIMNEIALVLKTMQNCLALLTRKEDKKLSDPEHALVQVSK